MLYSGELHPKFARDVRCGARPQRYSILKLNVSFNWFGALKDIKTFKNLKLVQSHLTLNIVDTPYVHYFWFDRPSN